VEIEGFAHQMAFKYSKALWWHAKYLNIIWWEISKLNTIHWFQKHAKSIGCHLKVFEHHTMAFAIGSDWGGVGGGGTPAFQGGQRPAKRETRQFSKNLILIFEESHGEL